MQLITTIITRKVNKNNQESSVFVIPYTSYELLLNNLKVSKPVVPKWGGIPPKGKNGWESLNKNARESLI